MMSSKLKTLLLGIDGASWDVLNPLLNAGKMPNLANLIERGTSCVLRSHEYSASPVAWTTIATGKEPAKHNIKDFRVSRHDLRAKQIWEILAGFGYKVGVFQYLVTWPPQAINGFIVPAWLAPDSATHPPELGFINEFVNKGRFARREESNSVRDYLKFGVRAMRYGLRLNTLISIMRYLLARAINRIDALETRYKIRRIWIQLSTDFFCRLMDRYQPDFAAIVFYQTDSIGHYFWKYREPNLFQNVDPKDADNFKDVIDKIYCDIDANLGRILRNAGKDCTVFVLSDHGMGPAVHQSGLLYRPRMEDLLESAGVQWYGGRHAIIGLDFHIQLEGNSPDSWAADYGRFKSFIEGIKVAESGEQVFETKLLPEGPALVRVKTARTALVGSTVQLPNGDLFPYESVVNTEEALSGAHHPEGVVIMVGPAVKQSKKLKQANLADIAPTLMALMGLPVGRDMDGKVLVEAIEESFLQNNPLRYVDSYETESEQAISEKNNGLNDEDRKIVEERLRSLGYLG